MANKRFQPPLGSPKGEVECPKGWRRVKFGDNGRCPLSGAQSCKDCDYEKKPEPGTGVVVK